MVNTRRTESSGMGGVNGPPRYQTRKTNDTEADVESTHDSETDCAPDSDESDFETSEQLLGNNTKNEPKEGLTPKVRTLRSNRFVFDERELEHLHRRELRSSRNLIKVNTRRHSLTAYSHHKMHNDLDSDGGCYSPSQHARKSYNRSSHHVSARMERRTALSLRPITVKSYKDHSPGTCNSDDSDYRSLRRSKRTSGGHKSMSWLTADQINKVGYPNLDPKYSDDSRDNQNLHELKNLKTLGTLETTKRVTRHSHENLKPNPKYLYSFNEDTVHTICSPLAENEETEVKHKNLRSSSNRPEVYDKENKEENIINGRRVTRTNDKDSSDGENHEPAENGDVKVEEEEESIEDDNEKVEEEEEIKEEESKQSDPSTEDDNIPLRMKTRQFLRSRRVLKGSGSSSTDTRTKPYLLRKRSKNISKQPDIEIHQRKRNSARRHFNRGKRSSSSSSSDSTDNDHEHRKPSKYSNSKNVYSKNDQLKRGGSKVMPVGPETLDPKVTFASVGGLDGHIRCLKEMIILPMMYPEVFLRFQILPPRGVLFHGPPGTGKTLLARALANECSFGSRKVSFFMQKGADLLSKWMGESEKQLRLLFEKAFEMKPSIIFFDELDGLAPVRSSKQDQIHASIVSTLLALMDGLNNRGEVIVIGATNRIDAIDPALRRPGRFDRELLFPLPAQKEREEILRVYVSKWANPPCDKLLKYLSENSVGYCGSDLRALCSEAVIQSFRRTYPQVYTADYRLLIDPETVKVEKLDFVLAQSMLVPASQRVCQNFGRKLPKLIEPLLSETLEEIMSKLEQHFPHGFDTNLAKVKVCASVRPTQLLILGEGYHNCDTSYLGPALLHKMEHLSAHTLDIGALHAESGRTPEETCIQVFHEAKRNIPSIIFVPNIDLFWSMASETVLAIFLAQLISIGPNNPILILATANSLLNDIPEQLTDIFSKYRKEIIEVKTPCEENIRKFYKPLIIDACLKPPRTQRMRPTTPPPLLKAPTPPPTPLTKEASKKLFEEEEVTMRELRIFLRDMCKKLASNRLFFMFTKPVDTEEVPDYPTIIKEPMDLETMMTKVDNHKYECAEDFLDDIQLICQNALEYNPAKSSVDKQIRHRACSLRDYAFALIKNEMDTDFEDKCSDISRKRKKRKAKIIEHLPPYLDIAVVEVPHKVPERDGSPLKVTEGVKSPVANNSFPKSTSSKKRKISSWQAGIIKPKKKKKLSRSVIDLQNNALEEKQSSGEDDSKSMHNDEDASTKTPLKPTAAIYCDTTTSVIPNNNTALSLVGVNRRLSELKSPSELLDDPLNIDEVDEALQEVLEVQELSNEPIEVNVTELEDVLNNVVRVTQEHNLESILDLYYQFSRIVKKFAKVYDRKSLPKEFHDELERFQKEKMKENCNASKNDE